MIAYIIKVNIALALFYAFYRLFCYRDTFFGWRRATLLCFYVVSALYPLLNIESWITTQAPMTAIATLYSEFVLPELIIGAPVDSPIDWYRVTGAALLIIYIGVALVLAGRIGMQLISLVRLTLRTRTATINGIRVHLLEGAEMPFSFFRLIFVNPDRHTAAELNEILTHEQTHATQWHSVDVLLGELACVLCWFNPFVWLMKREIRVNLEYLADHRVLKAGCDSKAYQYHLLGLTHPPKAAATIYNSFNVLPLKKRISMMNKQRTQNVGRTKYLMFIPLAALLMVISNIETVARSIQTPEQSESFSQRADTIYPVKVLGVENDSDKVFEMVEKMPQFPDGGMSALMTFLVRNIKYPANAMNSKTQGRVVVSFVVEKDGSITNEKVVRSVDPELDNEAIRVVRLMPKWEPGMQRGEAVRVAFTVPVMFRLDTGNTLVETPQVVGAKVLDKSGGKAGDDVFEMVEVAPQFPDGMSALMSYLSKNVKYPAAAQKRGVQGRVIVQFVVEKDGSITNATVARSVDADLDAEAIRVITGMPKWKPGMQRGEAVRVKFSVPLSFRIPEKKK
ncbi:MAG: M56 family metallopeptidase [Prevotellaceae bacterium]|jgi:TonB family protein|nr:M56 family metallopeptidase [Prevotellaceae bacterium]